MAINDILVNYKNTELNKRQRWQRKVVRGALPVPGRGSEIACRGGRQSTGLEIVRALSYAVIKKCAN